MGKTRKSRRPSLVLLLLVLLLTSALAALVLPGPQVRSAGRDWPPRDDFMPLSAVKRGMHGIGKTVVQGTKVEEFGVEVLGVLEGDLSEGDLILVRVSGKPVEAAGGISAGMSGSPVYIDGKLVGAISMTYQMSDHFIGAVTPIESMLKLFEMADPIKVGGGIAEGIAAGAAPGVPGMVPVSTPVMVSGITGRALDILSSRLKKRGNFMLVPAGGVPAAEPATTSSYVGAGHTGAPPASASASGGSEDDSIAPGSAFGIQLVRGDANVTAIGTVTYKWGDTFLGLGHPFMAKGGVNFFASGVYIHCVVPSMLMPFKIGTPTQPAGMITQDRTAGVLGDARANPEAIAVKVKVNDRNLKRAKEFKAEVVPDEDLAPDLITVLALQAIDATSDRIGRGTSLVKFEVAARGLENRLVRENMFFSQHDIAASSVMELGEAVSLLMTNEFKDLDIQEVTAQLDIDERRVSASIEGAAVKETSVKPGDTVHIEVKIRPFRAEPVTQVIALTIPEDTAPGSLYVTVRGGGVAPGDEEARRAGGKEPPKEGEKGKWDALDKMVKDFSERERNNDIVAEFYPNPGDLGASGVSNGLGGQGGGGHEGDKEPPPGPPGAKRRAQPGESPASAPAVPLDSEPIKSKISTEYVIEGYKEIEIQVSEAGEAKPEPGPEGETGAKSVDAGPPEGEAGIPSSSAKKWYD
ncbi:MAG: hypothetical protein HPY71_12970 [Firmicutes bacterium]|nr:hypothetical protein [Bacillota bacterium]